MALGSELWRMHNTMRKRRPRKTLQVTCQRPILTYDIDCEKTYRRSHVNQNTDASTVCNEDCPPCTIHNLVCTCHLWSSSLPLNLNTIAKVLPQTVQGKQKFAAVNIRLADPLCTVLLFTSGKMVLTGCKTFTDCLLASLQVTKLLRKLVPGVKYKLNTLQVQNIVANADISTLGASMDLNRMALEHNVCCTYQKSMFPGLVYRARNCPVVLLVFLSGKVVITGAKSTQDVEVGWQKVWPIVRQYICQNPAGSEDHDGSVDAFQK